jgi:hypothetical protein
MTAGVHAGWSYAFFIMEDNNMKTPRQIGSWLRKQPWYDEYQKEVMKMPILRKEKDRILRGHSGASSVSVFDWATSEKGYNYWNQRSAEFCKFYYGE